MNPWGYVALGGIVWLLLRETAGPLNAAGGALGAGVAEIGGKVAIATGQAASSLTDLTTSLLAPLGQLASAAGSAFRWGAAETAGTSATLTPEVHSATADLLTRYAQGETLTTDQMDYLGYLAAHRQEFSDPVSQANGEKAFALLAARGDL